MKKHITKALLTFSLIITSLLSQAQSWEVYNSKLELQSRVIYDHIELLSETVRIGHMDGSLFLLSGDLKPSVKLEADEVYQYLAPWIIVKGQNGLGAYHEYGQKNLANQYDEIQTYFNFLLARKGKEYFLFERGSGKTTSLGELEEAKITHTGMVITKRNGAYYLPLSKFPTKPYEMLSENESNFLLAKETTGLGLINREGDYILRPVLDRLEHNKGNFFYGFDESQYLLIEGTEKNGDIRYNSFHEITREGDLMLEYIHGKLRRVMDEDGILLDTVGLEKVIPVGGESYNVYLRDQKVGLLGQKGWLIRPIAEVDKIFPGSENLFPALKDGKMGVLNSTGQWQIQPDFDEIQLLSEERASYANAGNFGILDYSGEVITAPNWSSIKPFKNGVAIAEKNGTKVLIDRSGQELTTKPYDNMMRLENDLFIVEVNGSTGMIDREGNEILNVEFDAIQSISQNMILLTKENQVGMSNDKGEILLPIAYDEIILDVENNQILLKSEFIPVVIAVPENSKKKKNKGA